MSSENCAQGSPLDIIMTVLVLGSPVGVGVWAPRHRRVDTEHTYIIRACEPAGMDAPSHAQHQMTDFRQLQLRIRPELGVELHTERLRLKRLFRPRGASANVVLKCSTTGHPIIGLPTNRR